MKRSKYFHGFLILFIFLILCCKSLPGDNVSNISLEQAILLSAKELESQLPNGAQIAILTFTASSLSFSDYIISELAIAIASGNILTVIDRQNIEVIRKEMQIQYSGDISDNEIRRLGNQLGAQYVVTGSIVNIGNSYRFRVIAIDVETARHTASVSLNINNNDQILQSFLHGSNQEKIYKIGDYGPAGGLVFYDKGVFSNGWQYMEVAPLETEFLTKIGWDWEKYVDGTRYEVGFGKQNTRLIVEYFNQLGVTDNIAQLCNNLVFDGYDDWFLPSKDELNLLYQNLHQNNLGNFSNSWYCSSSIIIYWYNKNYYDVINQNFSNGTHGYVLLGGGPDSDFLGYRTRAIRYF